MTAQRRNEIKREQLRVMQEYNKVWRPHFVWLPVLTQDNYWVWFETVYRRREHNFDDWRYISDVHNLLDNV